MSEVKTLSLSTGMANSNHTQYKAPDMAFRGLLNMGVNLVMGESTLTGIAKNTPVGIAGGEDATDSEVTGSDSKEKAQQAVCLIAELKQSMQSVLGEAVKLGGEPMGDGVYTLTLFCALVEQALGHGLKESSGFRWPIWGAGKRQMTFFNVLECFEQSMAVKQATRESLGLDAVRGLTWVRSSLGQLRAWLRLSLNAGVLGSRLRMVLEEPKLLEQWYENWAVLRGEVAYEELVSVIMSLDATSTCLSVAESLALDHQKFVCSGGPSERVTQADDAKPDMGQPISSPMSAGARESFPHPFSEMKDIPCDAAASLEQKARVNWKGSSKKRFVSVLDENEHGQPILGTLDHGGHSAYATFPRKGFLHTAPESWYFDSSNTLQQKGLQEVGNWQDSGLYALVEKSGVSNEAGTLRSFDTQYAVSSPQDSDVFEECRNFADEHTIIGFNNQEEVTDVVRTCVSGQQVAVGMERDSEPERLPDTSRALSSAEEGEAFADTRGTFLLSEDDVFTPRNDFSVGSLSYDDFDESPFLWSAKSDPEDATQRVLRAEETAQNGEAGPTSEVMDDLVSSGPQKNSVLAQELSLKIEQFREESEVDWNGKHVSELMTVASSPSTSEEQERNPMSDGESDLSIFGDWAEGGDVTQLVMNQTRTRLAHSNRMNKVFSLCSRVEDELGFGARDWDDFEENDIEARAAEDPSRDVMVSYAMENSNLTFFWPPDGATQVGEVLDTALGNSDPGQNFSGVVRRTECTDLNYHENSEAERETESGLIGCGEAIASEECFSPSKEAEGEIGRQSVGHQERAVSVWMPQTICSVETCQMVCDGLGHDRLLTQQEGSTTESLLPSEVLMFEVSGSDGEGSQVGAGPQLNDEEGVAIHDVTPKSEGCGEELTQHAMATSLPKDACIVSPRKVRQRNVFSLSYAVGDFHEDDEHVNISQVPTRKGCVVRLGSKEAEELLQLDVTKLGQASCQSIQGGTSAYNRQFAFDWSPEDLGPDELSRYVEKLEVKETYMDTVLDMESVLLEADDSSRSRVFQDTNSETGGAANVHSNRGQYASTSAFHQKVQPPMSRVSEVVWVEVIGARQRRGGASLGERVVGVQEHTVYRILVKGLHSEWEIDRRYREFVLLHSKLLSLFRRQSGFFLPTPWDKVRVESRKIFGNTSPNVVEVRSALIQVCLHSLILAGTPLKTAGPLLDFLSPGDVIGWSSALPLVSSPSICQKAAAHLPLEDFISPHSQLPRSDSAWSIVERDQDAKGSTVFGKTIRLIVQVHAFKSVKQQLHAQHQACAGCYKHLVSPAGLVPSFVQTLRLAGPRLCEYTGQLFCSACHANEVAVIPGRVLQNWDFSPRKVSQLAKAYLDSIYDQPMLCVSAVNPYLYGKVPILANVREMRKKISRLVACLHCHARSRITSTVGSRRYLFENNDFFALRDLEDLSKGAFAVLPGFMKTTWERVHVHITRECSVCYETGEACGAGELCDDPLDTIFPFQDDNITRCPSCQLPFHHMCSARCNECPSCVGRPPAVVPYDTYSSSGYCTGESATRIQSTTTLDGRERSSTSGSSKRRSRKGSSRAADLKEDCTTLQVPDLSALSAPMEL